jgi:hypothetical protein
MLHIHRCAIWGMDSGFSSSLRFHRDMEAETVSKICPIDGQLKSAVKLFWINAQINWTE